MKRETFLFQFLKFRKKMAQINNEKYNPAQKN